MGKQGADREEFTPRSPTLSLNRNRAQVPVHGEGLVGEMTSSSLKHHVTLCVRTQGEKCSGSIRHTSVYEISYIEYGM